MARTVSLLWVCYLLTLTAILTSPATAQRKTAEFKVKDKTVALEYGVVRFGRHSLAEFKPDTRWRIGKDHASVFRTEVPCFSGSNVLAPGAYRVQMIRRAGDRFELEFEGGNFGLTGRAATASSVLFPAVLAVASAPAEKLEVECKAATKKSDVLHEWNANVVVRFGEHQLTTPFSATLGKSGKSHPWTTETFSYPAAWIKQRMDAGERTPIAVIRRPHPHNSRKTLALNLVLSKDGLESVPVPEAPTESFGFADPKPPDPAYVAHVPVTWNSGNEDLASFTIRRIESRPSGVIIEMAFSNQSATIPLTWTEASKR
ncbi:MAG TPA: hypothetical protein PKA37_07445 [Planctomycetota bacterium]|jgi:hypothetical protein|nr:hypothetical protein [Planctomycetota bacterium]